MFSGKDYTWKSEKALSSLPSRSLRLRGSFKRDICKIIISMGRLAIGSKLEFGGRIINAFNRKQPEWGAHLADELERIVALHDASNIAAVIVELVAGSTGVLIPPKGYLERLRAICHK